MGVSMSKSGAPPPTTTSVVNPELGQEDVANKGLVKPMDGETQIMELHGIGDVDDELDDKDWAVISQRLKTNLDDDQRRQTDRKVYRNGNTVSSVPGPVFASTLVERPTRVTSANFSPHAPVLEADDTSLPQVARQRLLVSDDPVSSTSTSAVIRDSLPKVVHSNMTPVSTEYQETDEKPFSCTSSVVELDGHRQGVSLHTNQDCSSSDTFSSVPPTATEIPTLPSVKLSSDRDGGMADVEGSAVSSRLDISSNGSDSHQGIDQPHSRASSVGTGSVTPASDVEDDVVREYYAELRRSMVMLGYFDKVPTPCVLRDAQLANRKLAITPPVDRQGRALPHPPKTSLADIIDPESFKQVDRRTLQADADLAKAPLSEVVSHLCVGHDDNRLLQLRAFCVWLAARQVERYRDVNSSENSPCDQGCMSKPGLLEDTPEGRCSVFRSMCRLCGLHSRLVHGAIRHSRYHPGEPLDNCRGVWVAVLLDNTWWLIDPVVDPRDPLNTPGNKPNTCTEDDPNKSFYGFPFCQDPEEFVFTHIPEDSHWQLLARPVLSEETTDLAVLRPAFFTLRMRLLSHPTSVVLVTGEDVVISLGFPANAPIQFACRLRMCSSTGMTSEVLTPQNMWISMNRFVFLETILGSSKINVKLVFPEKGSYILDVLEHDADSQIENESICTYKVIYENHKNSIPFPSNARDEWGPGLTALTLGIVPLSHQHGEISMDSEIIQIRFQDCRGLKFRYDLKKEDRILQGHVDFLRDDEQVVFVISLQIPGIYSLDLHARADTSQPFVNFCNHLIKRVKGKRHPDASRSSSERKQKKFNYTFNEPVTAESVDQRSPRSLKADLSGRMTIELDAKDICQMAVDMRLQAEQMVNMSEHTNHWREWDKAIVELNFPITGTYTLNVLGKVSEKKALRSMYKKSIQVVVPSMKWSPFPKVMMDWTCKFKLHAPADFHIEAKTAQTFKVLLPGAHDVAVLGTNGWSHLVEDEGTWSGEVMTGTNNTTCKLLARFEKGNDKYSELLMFQAVADDKLALMREHQGAVRDAAIAAARDQASSEVEH